MPKQINEHVMWGACVSQAEQGNVTGARIVLDAIQQGTNATATVHHGSPLLPPAFLSSLALAFPVSLHVLLFELPRSCWLPSNRAATPLRRLSLPASRCLSHAIWISLSLFPSRLLSMFPRSCSDPSDRAPTPLLRCILLSSGNKDSSFSARKLLHKCYWT